MRRLLIAVVAVFVALQSPVLTKAQVPSGPHNPILFVTQVPTPTDSANVASLFGNHGGSMIDAPRGGDLWIRYPDGTLKNLTKAAGYGVDGLQGAGAIAVRQPSVYWDGTKALFSMVVGGATTKGDAAKFYWQIYEVTGLGQNETPVITKIANQPQNFNNVSPIYGTDDRIIFTSDRPINGDRALYPAFDEYKGTHTNTGLWSLDPKTGDLFQMDHSPSGDFSPLIDSYGRVLVMRWDRLQRDRNADIDALGTGSKGTFNFTDESATATPQFGVRTEVFPEPQGTRKDLLAGTNMVGFEFNQFFPWMINEDGTAPETINHIGRHDMRSGISRAITDDSNVVNYDFTKSGRSNRNPVNNFMELSEDATTPGTYYGVDALQTSTHSGGQIISLPAAPTLDPNESVITYVTPRVTQSTTGEGATPNPLHSGFYRNPVKLSDGILIAAHSSDSHADKNLGTATNPLSRYAYRLVMLKQSGSYWVADTTSGQLTSGISKSLSYWDPNTLVTYSAPLWELDPVEVRSRARPPRHAYTLSTIERSIFDSEGVDLNRFRAYLRERNLAVAITRDVTHRDAADKQQPFYLHVAGSSKQTPNATGKIYDVSHLQFYQADYIRGNGLYTQSSTPHEGRRVIPVPMHSAAAEQPDNGGGALGSVKIASDGSMAAFVPARRAISWELVAPLSGGVQSSVVRERYWVTYQPGEVRVCASCHGTNDAATHPLNPIPQNPPEALHTLLQSWKSRVMPGHVQLQAPADAGSATTSSLNLMWKADTLATSYHAQLATDPSFTNVVFERDSLTTTSVASAGLQSGTTYYWRVMASNPYIDGAWSDTWSFTTASAGVTSSAAAPKLSLTNYPEPTSGRLSLLVGSDREEQVTISVFDLQGRSVYNSAPVRCGAGQSEIPLDLGDLPSGTYVVRLATEAGPVERVLHLVR